MKNERIAAADRWRQYQQENINTMFEIDRMQAEEEYMVCMREVSIGERREDGSGEGEDHF